MKHEATLVSLDSNEVAGDIGFCRGNKLGTRIGRELMQWLSVSCSPIFLGSFIYRKNRILYFLLQKSLCCKHPSKDKCAIVTWINCFHGKNVLQIKIFRKCFEKVMSEKFFEQCF